MGHIHNNPEGGALDLVTLSKEVEGFSMFLPLAPCKSHEFQARDGATDATLPLIARVDPPTAPLLASHRDQQEEPPPPRTTLDEPAIAPRLPSTLANPTPLATPSSRDLSISPPSSSTDIHTL